MGHFILKARTNLKDLKQDQRIEESDFSLQQGDDFLQFEYVEEEKRLQPYPVKPGVYAITALGGKLELISTTFTQDKILKDLLTTKTVTEKIDMFFNRLNVYYEEGIEVPKRGALLYGPAGCHAKGTKVIMYDGTIKNIEDVLVGDKLMGPDSKPREVLKLARGREPMVKIKPNKGEEFIVNINHILHLTPSHKNEAIKSPINIKFTDYLEQTSCFFERFKLTRTGVDYSKKELIIPPYILGLWLGDGNSNHPSITSMDEPIITEWRNYAESEGLRSIENNYKDGKPRKAKLYRITSGNLGKVKNTVLDKLRELEVLGNKHIPIQYLTSNQQDRLELLAGLLDTDGHLNKNNGNFDFIQKKKEIADQVVCLSRSLGFAAYIKQCQKSCWYNGEKRMGTYYRVTISGDLTKIPCRLERKKATPRKQIKDVLRTGFTYELLPEDDYYGFSLDGDHLYLTSDFTIHHNTGKSSSISTIVEKYQGDGKTAIIVWNTDAFEPTDVKRFIKSFDYQGVQKMILIAEDIGGIENDTATVRSSSSLLSLLDNKEKTFTIPIYIIATTNYAQNLMGNLTNRPDRFDDKLEIGYPTATARVELLKFYLKDSVTDDAIKLIESKKCEEYTPAHIREVRIRSRIHDKTPEAVIKEIQEEIESYKKAFSKQKSVGFGMHD